MEKELGLPPETPWVLHTDSLKNIPFSYYNDTTLRDELFDDEVKWKNQQNVFTQNGTSPFTKVERDGEIENLEEALEEDGS